VIARFANQADPLAQPVLGPRWTGFAARYPLAHRRITVIHGKRHAGGCIFDGRLSLRSRGLRIAQRERAINIGRCQALLEAGVPPLDAPDAADAAGHASKSESASLAFAGLTPDPLAGGPGGEVDPNQPVPPDLVDPGDAEPGNTDVVPQADAGTEADPGPPNGDPCQTAPCVAATASTAGVGIPCANGQSTDGTRCCIDHDCIATYPRDARGFVLSKLPPGWSTSAGEFHAWWEDPAQIDVASSRDSISYSFGGGCVHNPVTVGHQLNWYTTSGWYLQSENYRSGAQCAYAYHSTYAEMKNDVFCRALIGPLFGRTSRAYFDRAWIDGYSNGSLQGIWRSYVKGGCVRLLHFNHKLTRTAP
jgi:hypothetical protein